MTPHRIVIEHPARADAADRSVAELAAACPPQGELARHLPPELDDIGLVGGELRLAVVRGGLVSRVEFASPRKLDRSESGALRDFVKDQLLDGVGEGGLDGLPVELGIVGGRPGRVRQSVLKGAPPNRPALPKAAAAGDLPALRRALLLGEDVDTPDKWGQTALSAAVAGGHAAVCEVLLAAGADPDGHWAQASNTPLIQASTRGDTALVDRLLGAGARPDVRPAARNEFVPALSALGWAANRGHLGVVDRLLAAGADPDLPDERGRTPLHVCAPSQVELLTRLAEAGADLGRRDQQGHTPREAAQAQADAFGSGDYADPEQAAAHQAKADHLARLAGPA